MFWVQFRKQVEINTDPQRRCYNGAYFSSERVWTEWDDLIPYKTPEEAEESKEVFQANNPARQYRVKEK